MKYILILHAALSFNYNPHGDCVAVFESKKEVQAFLDTKIAGDGCTLDGMVLYEAKDITKSIEAKTKAVTRTTTEVDHYEVK